jgi:ADP-heptose:LPS heptosyltransferase
MPFQARANSTVVGIESAMRLAKEDALIDPKVIVYGPFKGMGDLLNAAPVILSELISGRRIVLLIFPGYGLENFVQLLDLGPNAANLRIVHLPVSGRLADVKSFFAEASQIKPDVIWISPHAPRQASSWKIPLLLWLVKQLFWRNGQLAGLDSERMSTLFDVRLPVSRDLSLMERERLAYSMLKSANPPEHYHHQTIFVERIRKHRHEAPIFDLLIHPGANAPNRRWPYEHFAALIRLIPSRYTIALLGVDTDIQQARKILPSDRGIQFLTGTLEQAITAIASSRVLLAVDSGNVHFANFLDLPAVGVFGKSAPDSIVGDWGSVLPIYEQKFTCQPCGRATCSQREVYCMNSIAPETVAKAVIKLLEHREDSGG